MDDVMIPLIHRKQWTLKSTVGEPVSGNRGNDGTKRTEPVDCAGVIDGFPLLRTLANPVRFIPLFPANISGCVFVVAWWGSSGLNQDTGDYSKVSGTKHQSSGNTPKTKHHQVRLNRVKKA